MVKSEALAVEIPFCAVAVLPWKDMVSFSVIAVVKDVYYADNYGVMVRRIRLLRIIKSGRRRPWGTAQGQKSW
jgi:hypothetical protein